MLIVFQNLSCPRTSSMTCFRQTAFSMILHWHLRNSLGSWRPALASFLRSALFRYLLSVWLQPIGSSCIRQFIQIFCHLWFQIPDFIIYWAHFLISTVLASESDFWEDERKSKILLNEEILSNSPDNFDNTPARMCTNVRPDLKTWS